MFPALRWQKFQRKRDQEHLDRLVWLLWSWGVMFSHLLSFRLPLSLLDFHITPLTLALASDRDRISAMMVKADVGENPDRHLPCCSPRSETAAAPHPRGDLLLQPLVTCNKRPGSFGKRGGHVGVKDE